MPDKIRRTFQVVTENGEVRVSEVSFVKLASSVIAVLTFLGVVAWQLALPLVDSRIDLRDGPLSRKVDQLEAVHESLATKDQLRESSEAILRAVARVEKQLDDAVERQTRGD